MKDKLVKIILESPQTPCVIGGRASGRSFQTAENIADHLLACGATIPVHCGHCKSFMEYTEEFKQNAEGADGDCYIRLMHSDDKQFCARKFTDYCSDGKPKEE